MSKAALLFFLLLSLSFYSPCRALSAPTPSGPPSAHSSQTALVQNAATMIQQEREIALLQEQIKVMKDYHGSLLSTIHWSLAGVFTIALVLAGFGWWSSFRVYENDKLRIQEDMTTKMSENEAKLALAMKTMRGEIERAVDTKNDIHSTKITTDISDVRQSLAKLNDHVLTQTETMHNKYESLKSNTVTVGKALYLTSAELRKVEEHIWELKKNPSNILVTQIQGLFAAVSAEDTDVTRQVLTRMKKTIKEKFIDAKLGLSKGNLDLFNNCISKVAEKMPETEVIEVLDLLSAVKIDEEVGSSDSAA